MIPSLFSQKTKSNEKIPELFAYVYTEDVKQKGELPGFSCGQIRKCNLTKSRLVGGVTLAEVLIFLNVLIVIVIVLQQYVASDYEILVMIMFLLY